jgi:hypothetical protein
VDQTDDPLAQLAAPPIFVVGQARSGTTWVHDIYRAHPLVRGVFESRLFERTNGIVGLLGSGHWGGRAGRGVGQLADRDTVVAEMRRFAGRLLAAGLQPRHRYLVEKTPSHARVMREITEVFPGSRFVHVVRDGRDVWVSAREARRTWARNWQRLPLGLELARTAHAWQSTIEAVREQAAALGPNVLEVRYEDLRADPFAAYRRLFDFATIPYDDDVLQRIFERTDFASTPRAADTTGFYRGGRVGDWRGGMQPLSGLVFNVMAGRMLVDMGYERSRLWVAPLRRAEKRSPASS